MGQRMANIRKTTPDSPIDSALKNWARGQGNALRQLDRKDATVEQLKDLPGVENIVPSGSAILFQAG
jgi:hypothetical protein